jgi:hypothetical protein
MSGSESRRDLRANQGKPPSIEEPAVPDYVAEVRAIDVFHDDVKGVLGSEEVAHAHNVSVGQPRCDLEFLLEATRHLTLGLSLRAHLF